MTELRVICAIAGEWGKPICQPHGVIPVCWNKLQMAETVMLMCLVTKGGNSIFSSKHFCMYILNHQLFWTTNISHHCSETETLKLLCLLEQIVLTTEACSSAVRYLRPQISEYSKPSWPLFCSTVSTQWSAALWLMDLLFFSSLPSSLSSC